MRDGKYEWVVQGRVEETDARLRVDRLRALQGAWDVP